jgi:hypothetical protein
MSTERIGPAAGGKTAPRTGYRGGALHDEKPQHDRPEDEPGEPGAEGGSGGAADVLPAAPADDDSPLGDTDQHSDADA